MAQGSVNPKRQETTRKQYVRRFKPTLTQEDLLELQKREEEGHAAFLLWKSEKDQQQKQQGDKEAEGELEKYHRTVVDDELRSLRKDMTFQLWQMEKEAKEFRTLKATEEESEFREHLDVLEAGRKHIVDFKNAKGREGWNDSFPFGEMALAQGPLLTQLRTPRTSNSGEEGTDSLGSAEAEVTLPVIQARDAATPNIIVQSDGLQSAPSEVQVAEPAQGEVHQADGGVATAEYKTRRRHKK